MAFRLTRPLFASASTAVGWGLQQRRAVSHLLGSRRAQQLPLQPRRARVAQPSSATSRVALAAAGSYRDRVTHLKRLHIKVPKPTVLLSPWITQIWLFGLNFSFRLVQDFVLIEDQLVTFAPGLNCITGASGSGKTVLVRPAKFSSSRALCHLDGFWAERTASGRIFASSRVGMRLRPFRAPNL